jgi:two-component system LytT family response regulator
MTLTALIADDEPLARRRLAALIADVAWVEQLGEAHDGAEAVELTERLRPDIVFLDIKMPELSGVEVVQRLSRLQAPPLVVFTTAHDEYAITAFELGALDYLLKPFGAKRFLVAMERIRRTCGGDNAERLARAQAALDRSDSVAALDRIFAREGNAVVPLPLAVIERVQAFDDYVTIHASQRRYLLSVRIRDLERRLPNPPFMRVHRSHIVNLDFVERIAGLDDSRFEVRLKSGAIVPVSRPRSRQIRRLSR